jgi:predicted ATPase
MTKSKTRPPRRIVLTGGPGGGKTTAAELFLREYKDQISLVPETATNLFKSGFPRLHDNEVIKLTQASIFYVQKNLESIHQHICPNRTLLCDRGTVDGAAYWPHNKSEVFFKLMGTTYEAELKRYDAVIFFETAAAGGFPINLGNKNLFRIFLVEPLKC